jgi:hypothetical protein
MPMSSTFGPLTSVPRVITDRYALPNGADPNACNVTEQTWCGGTWRTIKDNLDYIQNAGFTASKFLPRHFLTIPLKISQYGSVLSLRIMKVLERPTVMRIMVIGLQMHLS